MVPNTATFTSGFRARLQAAVCASASVTWVVPRTTATVRPQRSASELIAGPLFALT